MRNPAAIYVRSFCTDAGVGNVVVVDALCEIIASRGNIGDAGEGDAYRRTTNW
jgi:hypothetical protein